MAKRTRKFTYARRGAKKAKYTPVVPAYVGAESKFFDVDANDAVIASNGTIVHDSLNHIANGTGESNRIGKKCTVTSIHWRYRLHLPSTATLGNATEQVRTVIYLDKQCNGATAAVTDIFEADDILSFRNLANSGRFQILADKTFEMNSGGAEGFGAIGTLPVILSGQWHKKCNIPLEFNSTTGAIGEIRSNNLGLLVFGVQGVASLTSKVRLRFQG